MTEAHEALEAADQRRSERGMALVGVLLLLLMMSALGAAMTVIGETETLIARNQLAAAQAQAAAEAGLNHGVEVTTDYLFDFETNGFSSVEMAVDAVLTSADAGTVNGLTLNTPLTISADFDAQYQVDIFDDDDTASDENGDPLDDENDVLIIRSTGTARDGTKVVLEALISPFPMPAVLTNGDLDVDGNATIEGGPSAGVHANGDMTIGDDVDVTGNASATGDVDCVDPCSGVGGTITEGAPYVKVPDVDASDYFSQADFVLTSDGTMENTSGTVLCTASGKTSCNGWEWSAGQQEWSLQHAVTNGTYYVEGNVDISGNAGPATVSIIAEGSIDISGNPNFTPDTDNLLFVTNEDLDVSGTIGIDGGEGQILVKGQVSIHGNATLYGQLIVENEDVGDLVTSNVITGNATISYSGTIKSSTYTVSGWRDVRDAD